MTPLDTEYKTTKRIKKGEIILSQEFVELSSWIEKSYNVNVLNIVYDTLDNIKRPRLQIILEYERDSIKLNSLYGFGTTKQTEMSGCFINLVSEKLTTQITENIWIIIRSFEQPAKEETRWAISKKEIEKLESELNLKELWKIYVGVNYSITFFFFTNVQVQQFSTDVIKRIFLKKYFEILKRYDEFQYYKEDDLIIELESKENFEAHYGSNWFNYDRR